VSRDSAVGIAIGYGLEDWEVGVRVPVEWLPSSCSRCSLLRFAHPELFPGHSRYTTIILLFRGLCFWCLFFRFGGSRQLHNSQSLTLRNPMQIETSRFTTSYSWVWPKASYNVFILPRRSSCLLLRPPVPLTVVLPGLLWMSPLPSAGTPGRVKYLLAAPNFCRDPPSSWVCFSVFRDALQPDVAPYICHPAPQYFFTSASSSGTS
jgi:hypothetical protein